MPNQQPIREWTKTYGSEDTRTGNEPPVGQNGVNYAPDLADKNFVDLDKAISGSTTGIRDMALKILALDGVREANFVGADASDVRIRLAPSTDEVAVGQGKVSAALKEFVDDGIPLGEKGAEVYRNTIDLGTFLLKATDNEIKSTLKGTFYSSDTVFHAEDAYNKIIHERLAGLSRSSTQAEADKVAKERNYADLRQESVPINLRKSSAAALDVYTDVDPHEALAATTSADGKNLVPTNTPAEPIVTRDLAKPLERDLWNAVTTITEYNAGQTNPVDKVKIVLDASQALPYKPVEVEVVAGVNGARDTIKRKADDVIDLNPVEKKDLTVIGFRWPDPVVGGKSQPKSLTGAYFVAENQNQEQYLVPATPEGVAALKVRGSAKGNVAVAVDEAQSLIDGWFKGLPKVPPAPNQPNQQMPQILKVE